MKRTLLLCCALSLSLPVFAAKALPQQEKALSSDPALTAEEEELDQDRKAQSTPSQAAAKRAKSLKKASTFPNDPGTDEFQRPN